MALHTIPKGYRFTRFIVNVDAPSSVLSLTDCNRHDLCVLCGGNEIGVKGVGTSPMPVKYSVTSFHILFVFVYTKVGKKSEKNK